MWVLNKVLKHCVVSIKHQPTFAPFIKTVQTLPFLIMNCTYSCCQQHLPRVLPPLMRVQTDLAQLPKTSHLSRLVLQNPTSHFSFLVRIIWAAVSQAVVLGCKPKAEHIKRTETSLKRWSGYELIRTRLNSVELKKESKGLRNAKM